MFKRLVCFGMSYKTVKGVTQVCQSAVLQSSEHPRGSGGSGGVE